MSTAETVTGHSGQTTDTDVYSEIDKGTGKARLRRIHRLSRPFWASFVIGAASLLIFAALLVNTLDRQSITSSERVFGSILAEKFDRLSEITLEYGFWDEAVTHLVDRLDMEWVDSNLVEYIYAELGVIGVHVLDGQNSDHLHVYEDIVADGSSMTAYGGDATRIINHARRSPDNEAPIPVTGFLGTAETLFMASAVRMTTYDRSDTNTSTDHVMMFVRQLDDDALIDLSRKFQMPGLNISTEDPGYFQASWPIANADGIVFARFVWDPELPGRRLLLPLTLGLLIVYLGMMFAARAFLKQATQLVVALENSRRRTEEAKELLASQAKTDSLTGLCNRRHFETVIDELSAVANGRREFALMCIDLDWFKAINDSMGHEIGDEVLKYVADVLRSLIYPQDRVFRLGGDEFVIIFGFADKDRIAAVGQDAITILSRPAVIKGKTCTFGASAGVAYSVEPVKLLRRADAALYKSKKNGRGQVSVYVPDEEDTPTADTTVS
ncbi:sensor domain-containing diguanylate cyclase [Roseibium sp.]|uniref:sensor domain-containing diguanylate cyclase n=1 Tax=Roseibium sp. TaxID=1936156 RepID=UPI003B51B4D9